MLMDAGIYQVRPCGLMEKAPDFADLEIAGSSPVMVGRVPKFLGALKAVPKLVAHGCWQRGNKVFEL